VTDWLAHGIGYLKEPTTWLAVYVLSEWAVRVVMTIVVPFRRSPAAAKGWLLLVFFLPWPAVALYWAIGRARYPDWRRARFRELPAGLAPAMRQVEPFAVDPGVLSPTAEPTAELARRLSTLPPLSGNTVELIADYDRSLERLAEDIDAATDHVHLLYYIFAYDAATRPVRRALARAAARGVTCRVLYDTLGSRKWSRKLERYFAKVGVAAHPVLPTGLIGRLRGRAARADLRNHRKIAVIDGRVGYTGSQNLVGKRLAPMFGRPLDYEELVARVQGPVVGQLAAVFSADWFLELHEMPPAEPDPTRAGDVIAQVLPSGPDFDVPAVEHIVVDLIHAARRRVVMTTPYFIPEQAVLQALDTATYRGVEVHLIVSVKADQLLVSLAQKSYYAELMRSGVQIHRYRDRFLHAKHLSVDDEAVVVGSSNMDIRSFRLNAEVSLLVWDREVASALRAHQDRYLADSETLDLSTWEARPLWRKVPENLARLVSPLL
jgi:cardiolipin synthase